jgi:hypothetical protein
MWYTISTVQYALQVNSCSLVNDIALTMVLTIPPSMFFEWDDSNWAEKRGITPVTDY